MRPCTLIFLRALLLHTRVPEERGGSTNAWTSVEAGATIPTVKWHRWYKRARAASLTRESKSRLSVCAGLDSAGVTVRHPGRPRPVSRCSTTTLDIVKAAVRDEIPLTDSSTPAFEPFRRGLFNFLVCYSLTEFKLFQGWVCLRSFERSNLWDSDRSRGDAEVCRFFSCIEFV